MTKSSFFTDSFCSELIRERKKLRHMIESADPFANSNELTQSEIYDLKLAYNRVLALSESAGIISNVILVEDSYVL